MRADTFTRFLPELVPIGASRVKGEVKHHSLPVNRSITQHSRACGFLLQTCRKACSALMPQFPSPDRRICQDILHAASPLPRRVVGFGHWRNVLQEVADVALL